MRQDQFDTPPRSSTVQLVSADRAHNGEIHDASIGALFKQLSTDSTHLLQQEVQLAKAELNQSVAKAAGAGVKIGTAVVLALPGIMAVTAALVIGLGLLIGSYWVSALLVGVLILAVAGTLMKRAMADLESGLAPQETIETVREDVEWAKDESQRVKARLSA